MVTIRAYTPSDRDELLALAVRTWGPVFERLQGAVPAFVYESFWPRGWETRQVADLGAVLDEQPGNVDVAVSGDDVAGWVCTQLHPEDDMGEVHVLAVDPAWQRQGVASALLEASFARVRRAGMRMVMVETGDDPGHAPARALYEQAGFERWPVARYFKELR